MPFVRLLFSNQQVAYQCPRCDDIHHIDAEILTATHYKYDYWLDHYRFNCPACGHCDIQFVHHSTIQDLREIGVDCRYSEGAAARQLVEHYTRRFGFEPPHGWLEGDERALMLFWQKLLENIETYQEFMQQLRYRGS